MTIPLNLGIRAHDLGPTDLDTLIEKLIKYDLNHIQFALKKSFPDVVDTYDNLTPGLASFYGNQFSDNKIALSILGCYVNIIDQDEKKRRQALHDFEAHLRLAKCFKASMVATETGSMKNGYTKENYTENAYNEVVSSVKSMIISAEKFGETIAIEAGINHPIYTAKLAKRLIDDIDSSNLKIILDFANLMNADNHLRQEEVIQEAIDLLDKEVIAIHLKDYVIDNGKVKIVPVGEGNMKFETILRYVKYNKPNLFVSLESTREPQLTESIRLLKNLYEKV